MQLRRPARRLAAAGALLLAAPVLSSCGFDYATDRVYTPGVGTNDRTTPVDVLSAVVVSAEPGSGTFIATFSNNDAEQPTKVQSITSEDVDVVDFEPFDIPRGGIVNLADAETPLVIEGDYDSGDFLTFEFVVRDNDGEESTSSLEVPVVVDCAEYAGLDATAPSPVPATECEIEESLLQNGH